MRSFSEKYGRTPVQKEVNVVMKKAYCGFERLAKEHDDRIKALLEGIRCGRVSEKAA